MTRTALGAALLCLGALLIPEPSHAAQGARPAPAFRAHGVQRPFLRPPPFRAHGLQRPLAPRVLSHGAPPKHRFHPRHPRHRLPTGLVFLPALSGAAFFALGAEAPDAPRGPALVRAGSTAGCATEDVTVPGSGGETVVTIIRC
jgi:hypothetical protein